MKKLALILLAVFVTGSILTSCKSHGNCAGITTQKVEKVKVSALPRSI